jgi:heat shock protein HslJ
MTSSLRSCVLLGSCALVLACDSEPEATSLDGRVFVSQSVTEDGTARALVDGSQLRLRFEGDEVNGAAGCNSIGGSYSIEGGTFAMTDGGQTLIGCDQALVDQESWYFAFLTSSPSIVIDGDSLVLDGDGTRIEYLDEEVATPDAELVGVTWTVDTIISGGLAQHAEWPSPATLVFEADGTVAVNTGCNAGSGTYQTAATELSFADVAVTERGCDDPSGELERAVLGLIHGPQPVTWEVTVDRLSLRGADFGLDLEASEG